MGTRGLVGFFVDDEPKLTYNHFDSYPSGLGVQTLDWLRKRLDNGIGDLKKQVLALQTVSEGQEQEKPPQHVIDELAAKYGDPTVGNQGIGNTEIHTWYQLLRGTQGDLDAILDSGYMIDSRGFALDGLFCEWAYVVVLDGDGVFQAYQGWQQADHTGGLWGSDGPLRGDWKPEVMNAGTEREYSYYPVKLVGQWGFHELPSDGEFIAQLEGGDDD